MAAKHFLAFDLGAESGRALIGTLENGRLSLEEKHRFSNPTGRINGHFHWDLLGQWEELKTGLRKAAADRSKPIDGIGVDTWGVDYGLVARDGAVLGYPYHYRDTRTDGMMDKAFSVVSRADIFHATGLQFMQINSLFQLLAQTQAKDPMLDAAETLLFMPDLFNYLFTGVRKAEFSIASTSQMLDPGTRKWAIPLLQKLGIPTRLLPEIIMSGTRLGPVKPDVAAECGAGPIPVIATGGHDTASAVAAVPAAAGTSDWCYISSGTWSLMGVESDKPVINEKSLQYNYTNEGGVSGNIRFLKNIMGLWLVQECRRQWQRDGAEHNYAELTRLAAESKPFGPVFDPGDGPFGLPGDMPGKIARYCQATGQTPPADKGQTVRSCLESLALAYRRTLEGMEDVMGRKINVIHIVGGGTQNELLSQMTADACGRPVIGGPVEATAIGNILVQAISTGDVKSLDDARSIVRASFDVKRYEPKETARWNDAYGRFSALVKS